MFSSLKSAICAVWNRVLAPGRGHHNDQGVPSNHNPRNKRWRTPRRTMKVLCFFLVRVNRSCPSSQRLAPPGSVYTLSTSVTASAPLSMGAIILQPGYIQASAYLSPSQPVFEMSSRPPDKNPPLTESDSTFYLPQGTFEIHLQDASSVPYPDPQWPLLYTVLQDLGLVNDRANAAQPLPVGSLIHGDSPPFPHPEAAQSADLATDVQAVKAPGDGKHEVLLLRVCKTCNRRFGRLQELKRHMGQVHQPLRKCPFNRCAYKWKRPDIIKTHITNKHRNELCPEVFQKVSALRGKSIVEFVDAYELGYNFKTPTEPYVSFSLPPLAWSENFMLSEYCGCCLGSGDVFSSEDVVEQTVEESTVLPEGT